MPRRLLCCASVEKCFCFRDMLCCLVCVSVVCVTMCIIVVVGVYLNEWYHGTGPGWNLGRQMLAGNKNLSFLSFFLLLSLVSCKNVVIIGAGWGGLSAAHHLSKVGGNQVTVVDAAARPGGLVSDSWLTPGGRRAEAGQCVSGSRSKDVALVA